MARPVSPPAAAAASWRRYLWALLIPVGTRLVAANFESLLADVFMCTDGSQSCTAMKFVVADYSVLPYGRRISLEDFRVWLPGLDAAYPESCGQGPQSPCQYACTANDLQTNNGPLSFQGNVGMAVLRSLTVDADDPQSCSFIDKSTRVAETGASTVVIINNTTSEALTMDTGTGSPSLRLGVQAPPTFSLQQQFIEPLSEFVQQARQADPNARITTTIDMTNLFPERAQINVTLWQTQLWDCASHSESANCLRKARLLDGTNFSRAMQAWLRQGIASFSIRLPFLKQCYTGPSQDDQPPATPDSAFCQQPNVATQNCINQMRYCHPDPDDNPSSAANGRDVLLTELRSKCVSRVTQQFLQPQQFIFYLTSWQSNCNAVSDYTEECALRQFEESVLPLWTSAALDAAGTSRGEIREALISCVRNNTDNADADVENELLEEDTQLDDSIRIDPTAQVNGAQIRGAYTPDNLLAALCSAFPDGREPESCQDFGIDECAPGEAGYLECRSGALAAAGRTRCVADFTSFTCKCPVGQIPQPYTPTAEERANFPEWTDEDFFRCQPRNQCDPELRTCEVGVCLNQQGTHRCITSLQEQCTAANTYGGCFVSDLRDETGEPRTACVSRLDELRERGRDGDSTIEMEQAFECDCRQLPCFRGDGRSCAAACSSERCLLSDQPQLSTCLPADRGDSFVGTISPAALASISIGLCITVLGLGGFLIYRYHRETYHRLNDIDALVRQLPVRLEDTGRLTHTYRSPMQSMSHLPNSMYINAAYQQRPPGSELSSTVGDSGTINLPRGGAHSHSHSAALMHSSRLASHRGANSPMDRPLDSPNTRDMRELRRPMGSGGGPTLPWSPMHSDPRDPRSFGSTSQTSWGHMHAPGGGGRGFHPPAYGAFPMDDLPAPGTAPWGYSERPSSGRSSPRASPPMRSWQRVSSASHPAPLEDVVLSPRSAGPGSGAALLGRHAIRSSAGLPVSASSSQPISQGSRADSQLGLLRGPERSNTIDRR